MLKTKKDIQEWLDKYKVVNYTINDDLTVDVDDDLHLAECGLTDLPIQFGKVQGTAYFGMNQLTSFKGMPNSIKGHLNCENNLITNFEHCPKFINGLLICSNNPIKSLKGFNSEINGNLYHSYSVDENIYTKIIELEHLYENKKNRDMEFYRVSVSKEEINAILSYIELNDTLASENTTTIKKSKL